MARSAAPTKAAPAPKRPPTNSKNDKINLTDPQRLQALELRVEVLESERPGRKPRPMLAIRQRDVCAIDPNSDSTKCPYASIYRYQSGCHGAKCRLKQHEAYERRKGNAKPVKVTAARRKAPVKKAVKVQAPPTKRVVSKKAAPIKAVKRVSKRTAA